MKKTLLSFLLFCFLLFYNTGVSFAQSASAEYLFEKEIPYYPSSSDTYKDSICRLDIYAPKNKPGFATVVWFHGGGLTGGEKDFPKELRENGFAVISVGYRLYPKIQCPGYLSDAASATAWVFQNISKYGGDSKKIVLSGHSAGGYLAMMVGMDSKWLKQFEIQNNSIAAIIPLSGQCITHFTIRKERNIPELQPTIDEYAPIFHVSKDLPPLILITGDREKELFGRYEENAYLARMMKLLNHPMIKLYELEGFDHGSMVPPGCLLLVDFMKKIQQNRLHN